MEPMIKIEHLDKTFKGKTQTVYALKDINLDIQKGDIFGIIGMSGAGKSTLIRCMNFLERPTSGTVKIDGKDLAALSDKELRKTRQEVAMIFQHFNLLQQIRPSCPVGRSSEWPSRGLWRQIQRLFSAMKRPAHWTRRRPSLF